MYDMPSAGRDVVTRPTTRPEEHSNIRFPVYEVHFVMEECVGLLSFGFAL